MSVITSEPCVSELYPDAVAAPGRRRTGMRRVLPRISVAVECGAEFLTCSLTTLVTCSWLLHGELQVADALRQVLGVSLLTGLFALVVMQRSGASAMGQGMPSLHRTAAAVRMSARALLLIVPSVYVLRLDVPCAGLMLSFALMPLLLALQRQLLAPLLRRLCGEERVVICGAGDAGARMAERLLREPKRGFRPVAVLDEELDEGAASGAESPYGHSSGTPAEGAPLRASHLQALACTLVVAGPLPAKQMEEMRAAAREAGIPVARLAAGSLPEDREELIEIDGFVLTVEQSAETDRGYIGSKRLLDLMLAAVLLAVLSPVLVLIALLIRVTSPGPALFVQQRVGEGGRLFRMYKFRSMFCLTRPYESSPSSSSDPRITRFGRFLRRTSLDELPQLMNVVRGDMSLVGPRPEMPFIVRSYNAHQRQRLQVTPGITGLWQLSGDRATPIHDNVHHDLAYIRRRSLSLDVAILIHTLLFAMHRGI